MNWLKSLAIAFSLSLITLMMPPANGGEIQDAIEKARQAQLDYEKRIRELEEKAKKDNEEKERITASRSRHIAVLQELGRLQKR
jgi:hypothetical protein